ncbi:MAG: hypothetical protein AB4042_07685 [Leptolyngbyaceae cyanobacterium]
MITIPSQIKVSHHDEQGQCHKSDQFRKQVIRSMMAIAILSTSHHPTPIQANEANSPIKTQQLASSPKVVFAPAWSQSTAYVPPEDLGLPSRREPGGDR